MRENALKTLKWVADVQGFPQLQQKPPIPSVTCRLRPTSVFGWWEEWLFIAQSIDLFRAQADGFPSLEWVRDDGGSP